MKSINILIVEDESIVAMEIESYIQKLGYNIITICSNAKDTLHTISEYKIDIILMDICIKGKIDGVETAMLIKKSYPHIKIIFLTAHLDDYNVDRAIEVNPIAYLSKPFNREELRVFLKIAHRKIVKNHIDFKKNQNFITLDDEYTYNLQNHILYYCSEIIHLTKKECDLLELLIKNQNHIVDFYTIENCIWPEKATNTNTIRTLVKRLRQKFKHKLIKTIFSRGYKLEID
ncbi:MAG: response regulator [Campylobacterota bacterium]|nr:response regulator [Campylobacterota bacterium]